MYVYIHTYMHTYTYTYLHIYMYVCMYIPKLQVVEPLTAELINKMRRLTERTHAVFFHIGSHSRPRGGGGGGWGGGGIRR
jgi:hypothetical protein